MIVLTASIVLPMIDAADFLGQINGLGHGTVSDRYATWLRCR